MSLNLTNHKYRSLITGTDEYMKYLRQRLGFSGSIDNKTSQLYFVNLDSFALIATFSVENPAGNGFAPGRFLACDYDIEDPNNSYFYTNSGANNNNSGLIGKYNIFGSQSWSYDHGIEISSVAVDKSGNVYIGGSPKDNATTRKLSATGSVIWSANHNVSVNSIAVDTTGNVYTGGNRDGSFIVGWSTTRKYNSSGVEQWKVDHGGVVNGIVVNSSGELYTVGQMNSNIGGTNSTTRKYDTSGNLLWSRNHGTVVQAITIDSSGNIYTSGGLVSGIVLRKYDASGNLIWSVSLEEAPSSLAIDVSGNLYTFDGIRILRFDLDGNLLDTFTLYPNYPQLFPPFGFDTHPSTRNQL